jgi:hypothetical protein
MEFADANKVYRKSGGSPTITFVLSTLDEGHQKRFGPAATLFGTVALSFVIPRSRLACGKLRGE